MEEMLAKINEVDMTIPAGISFACACLAVAIHSWPLVAISMIIDILVASVASGKVIQWIRNT